MHLMVEHPFTYAYKQGETFCCKLPLAEKAAAMTTTQHPLFTRKWRVNHFFSTLWSHDKALTMDPVNIVRTMNYINMHTSLILRLNRKPGHGL